MESLPVAMLILVSIILFIELPYWLGYVFYEKEPRGFLGGLSRWGRHDQANYAPKFGNYFAFSRGTVYVGIFLAIYGIMHHHAFDRSVLGVILAILGGMFVGIVISIETFVRLAYAR